MGLKILSSPFLLEGIMRRTKKVIEYEFIETVREMLEPLDDFATDEPHLEKLRESESPYNL